MDQCASYTILGNVWKQWNGGGEDKVHSRVVAALMPWIVCCLFLAPERPKSWQDDNVDFGVGNKPEEMLEQERGAARPC